MAEIPNNHQGWLKPYEYMGFHHHPWWKSPDFWLPSTLWVFCFRDSTPRPYLSPSYLGLFKSHPEKGLEVQHPAFSSGPWCFSTTKNNGYFGMSNPLVSQVWWWCLTLPKFNSEIFPSTDTQNPIGKTIVFQSHHFAGSMWVIPKIVVPQNGWFILENPIKNGCFGGTTILGNPHVKFSGV